MRVLALLLSCGLLAFMATVGAAPASAADTPDDLIGELRCPGSAGFEPLATSSNPEAVRIRGFIRDKAAQGWSRQRIMDTLVQQYGEQILPAPPKEGFSLAAWITPFVTILGGVGVVGFLLTRWLRERKRHDAYLIAEMTRRVDEEDLRRYETQLQRDLEQFE